MAFLQCLFQYNFDVMQVIVYCVFHPLVVVFELHLKTETPVSLIE